jgi:MoaA/NifB/PqqE/SkfB family radical SAM enzyme
MPAEDIIRAMDTFRRCHGTEEVVFLGGEPFEHPDLQQMAAAAKSMGFWVNVYTNGLGIAQRLESLVGTIDCLTVSLDGLEKANDHIRGRGSYQSALQGIQTAINLGQNVAVTMAVHTGNIRDTYPLALMLDSIGVGILKIQRVRSAGRAAINGLSLLDPVLNEGGAVPGCDEVSASVVPTMHIKIYLDALLASPIAARRNSDSHCAWRPSSYRRVQIMTDGQLFFSCEKLGVGQSNWSYDFATGAISRSMDSGSIDDLHLPGTSHLAVSSNELLRLSSLY